MSAAEKIFVAALVVLALALLLAIVINRFARWWRHRPIWYEIENPPPRERRRILPPHKSAARPSNVQTIARKPSFKKSTPKTAA